MERLIYPFAVLSGKSYVCRLVHPRQTPQLLECFLRSAAISHRKAQTIYRWFIWVLT